MRIGLGLAAVARPAYITTGRTGSLGATRSVAELRARTWELLDAAYAAGIRYVDVARSYGKAEEFLAGWLEAHPAVDDLVIGSKWGYRYVGGWRLAADVHEVKDHSRPAFAAQWAETQALLGERLAVYHLHSATLDSGALDDSALHADAAILLARTDGDPLRQARAAIALNKTDSVLSGRMSVLLGDDRAAIDALPLIEP